MELFVWLYCVESKNYSQRVMFCSSRKMELGRQGETGSSQEYLPPVTASYVIKISAESSTNCGEMSG